MGGLRQVERSALRISWFYKNMTIFFYPIFFKRLIHSFSSSQIKVGFRAIFRRSFFAANFSPELMPLKLHSREVMSQTKIQKNFVQTTIWGYGNVVQRYTRKITCTYTCALCITLILSIMKA